MKTIRRICDILVALFMVFTMLPTSVRAEGYSIPAPEEFHITADTQTFNMGWKTSYLADYYVTQYKPTASTEGWTNTSSYAIRQMTDKDPSVSHYFYASYSPTDTKVAYDFRVFACDANGNQTGEAAEIDNQILLQQDADIVEGVDNGKIYPYVSSAFADGEFNVKLNKDLIEQVDIGNTVTASIDLNGHKLTATNGYALENYGTCTIRDSVGGGVITSDQGTTPVWNGNIYNDDGSTKSVGRMTIESGTIRRAHAADGSDGNITTLRNYGLLYLNGGKIDGGWILTGWDAPGAPSYIKMVTPLDYEVTTIGPDVDLTNATVMVWPHGLVKYTAAAPVTTVSDQSTKYTNVTQSALTSADKNVQDAAKSLAFGSYLLTPMVDPAAISGLSTDGSPIYSQADIESAATDSNGKIISTTYQLTLEKAVVDDNGKVTGTEAVEPGKTLTMNIALADGFDVAAGDSVLIKHTLADGTVKVYTGVVYVEEVNGISIKRAVFDNPDGFSTFEISKNTSTPAPAAAATPAAVQASKTSSTTTAKQFLITYLDCKGNTVSVQWVPYGGSPTAPAGYNFPTVNNVTAHQDVRPTSCNVQAKFIVPNTADRG